jgi:hypothetical protein
VNTFIDRKVLYAGNIIWLVDTHLYNNIEAKLFIYKVNGKGEID